MTPSDFEQFHRLVVENGLSESDLADLGRRWRRDRREGETLVTFLSRSGWIQPTMPVAAGRAIDYGYL
jgi:hypothetical protein